MPPLPTPTARYSRTVELRVALSATAQRTLSEPRLRRLIEIETEDIAVLSPGTVGPLGDHVAYVWIDQPAPPATTPNGDKPNGDKARSGAQPAPPNGTKIFVEVRVGDHAVERREIAIRGLTADVAARFVAIAVSELVRAGLAPKPALVPTPEGPRPPTPEERERAARDSAALFFAPTGAFAGLPGGRGALGGAGLSAGFRWFGVGETIFARWMSGNVAHADVRWLELGLDADYRFWLHRAWRLGLGGQAALSSVHVADAAITGGGPDQRDTWSARAGGLVSVEARLAPWMWLALDLEPGIVLRPVSLTDAAGITRKLQGAWLGAGLSVRFEKVREPAP